MTVAAMGSMVLADLLRQCHPGNLDGLAADFQKALMKLIDTPWQLATGEDRRWPLGDEMPQSSRAERLMQGYIGRVLDTLLDDPAVSDAFLAVQQMLAPPTRLFHPDVAYRVMRAQWPRRRGAPGVPSLPAPARTA